MSTSAVEQKSTAADDSEKTGKEETSRLLALPPELRNRIYSYLLECDEGFCFPEWEYDEEGELRSQGPCYPGVLATCRFIQHEATPILYGANQFAFEHWRVANFLNKIGASAQFLRHVKIFGNTWVDIPRFADPLQRATALETLEIEVDNIFAYMFPREKEVDRWAEKSALALFEWVSTQRSARRGTEKKDPVDELRIFSEDDREDEYLKMTVEKLAWKLTLGQLSSRGYQFEWSNADEARKKRLDHLLEKSKKLESKLSAFLQ